MTTRPPDGPRTVPFSDRRTRVRAAVVVAQAYMWSPLHWAGISIAIVLTVWAVSPLRSTDLPPELIPWILVSVLLATTPALIPIVAIGLAIWRTPTLWYYDNGKARAALAIRPDTRRRQLPGDHLAHTFGAWPKSQGAGTALGRAVRDHVHTLGGRMTGTTRNRNLNHYLRHGMHADGSSAYGLFTRIASKSRTRENQ
ncbi:MAG: hypothetical protein ACRCYU_12065 [Nocardioides sp.]